MENKKVGAPYGNRNAEKWKFKKAIQLFNDAIELSNQKEEIIIRDKNGIQIDVTECYEFDFIGEIASELGTYHALITRDLIARFPILKKKLNILINNLERNCYSNTKKENINVAVGIINLKSNHKWTDRIESDITSKGEKLNNGLTGFEHLSVEEAKRLLKQNE